MPPAPSSDLPPHPRGDPAPAMAGFQLDATAAQDEPTHPSSHALVGYCERLRGDADVMARGALRIRDIPDLLPFLFVAEPRGEDWRFRLYGTGLARRSNREFTGKCLHQVFEPDTATLVRKLFESVARRKTIRTTTGRYLGLGIEHARCEMVFIPMRAQRGDVLHVLGAVFFFN